MKKFLIKLFCLLLFIALISMPSMAAEKEEIAPSYSPSTQLEARSIPLNLEHGGGKNWSTLYNPCTAEMMVEFARASRHIGKGSDWGKTMEEYGYSQLQYTEDNIAYNRLEYHLGWKIVENKEIPVTFRAVNAIVGLQKITYNGRERYAVAITFRGSSDFEDWMCDIITSNSDVEGFHKGFAENAEYFYNVLSKELFFNIDGQEVSLYDIYDEMKSPDSDYCMLVMGHSLGGALTNLLVGKHMYQHGVHPSNVAGYGFAVPLTSPGNFVEEYPYDNIINIINCDDPVPYLTLNFHKRIGRDIVYYPDAEFRASHYAKDFPEAVDETTMYWRTVGTLKSLGGPHLIDVAYADIVKIISDEIGASTPENPSNYTNLSTSGYNDWGFLGDIAVSQSSFGNFEGSINVSGNLLFDGGVLEVHGALGVDEGILMQNDTDYLKVWGNLKIAHGMHLDYPDHLTAGTIELKGDLTTGNYSFNEYSYRATGTHRTVLSGTETQTLYFDDEDVRFENLYIRNPNINFSRYVPYMRLAEDGVINSTEGLVIWNLDLNGYELVQNGNAYINDFVMNKGKLMVDGNAEINNAQKVDGKLTVSGNLEHPQTLKFGGGQVLVGGDCYLPNTMIMQDDKDYLSVDGNLTVFAIDELPDDHLSAGTVEVKKDLAFEARGVVCDRNAYRETGTHRTILSGDGVQTLWWINRAGAKNRLENLCIRNPNIVFNIGSNDIRLGENATIKIDSSNRDRKLQIGSILDVAEYTMNIEASDWEFTDDFPVIINSIKSDSGMLYVKGDMMFTGGKVEGNAIITGDLIVESTLHFNGGNLQVGGNCTTGASMVMKNDDDYLLVEGDLTLNASGYYPIDEDHLSAGTVELKGNLTGNTGGYNYRVYRESGTHRTILSGDGVQYVRIGGIPKDKVLQVCLKNPDVIIQSAYALRLMEDTYQNDISGWGVENTLDLNGYSLITPGAFKSFKQIKGIKSKRTGCLLQMQVESDWWTDITTATIECTSETNDSIYVIVAGYDSKNRMVASRLLTFTSKGEMIQTLQYEDFEKCEYTKVFWLDYDFVPFCNGINIDW